MVPTNSKGMVFRYDILNKTDADSGYVSNADSDGWQAGVLRLVRACLCYRVEKQCVGESSASADESYAAFSEPAS